MVKTCAFCDKTDGLCYGGHGYDFQTSNPPVLKCTITGKFHDYNHICDVPKTNADRIRAMSDEELAKWITYACDVDLEMFCSNPKRTRPCDNNCDLCAIDWLEQPAEEET